MKKTFTVMMAILTMIACVSCMDRTRDNAGRWDNTTPNPNVNVTPNPDVTISPTPNPNLNRNTSKNTNPKVSTTPDTVNSLDYLQ